MKPRKLIVLTLMRMMMGLHENRMSCITSHLSCISIGALPIPCSLLLKMIIYGHLNSSKYCKHPFGRQNLKLQWLESPRHDALLKNITMLHAQIILKHKELKTAMELTSPLIQILSRIFKWCNIIKEFGPAFWQTFD
ncbi:hypothetical protein L3X38_016760 [Prunus dulcis]|uniref:Uncharacterized protein n=1 Tax=Prunus dulcis TaxID=3755 RepID=A0AAD4W7I8_PRUDU|nr:hypothetical protein L3X38_016760 [Prunus dulcis]